MVRLSVNQLNAAAKRIPMIQFRAGQPIRSTATTQSTISPAPGTVLNQGAAPYSSTAIEDWELPERFKRKAISVEEMEVINRGGPDK